MLVLGGLLLGSVVATMFVCLGTAASPAAAAEAAVLRAAIARQKALIADGPPASDTARIESPDHAALAAAELALSDATRAVGENPGTVEEYDRRKEAVRDAGIKLEETRATVASFRLEKAAERERHRRVAVKTLHMLTEQLKQQTIRQSEAAADEAIEAGTEHAFGDLLVVAPAGGAAATHVTTVIWLHGLGEQGSVRIGCCPKHLIHASHHSRFCHAHRIGSANSARSMAPLRAPTYRV